MKWKKRMLIFWAFYCCTHLFSSSLKFAFEEAQSFGTYDKYIELENGVIYTGGLFIGAYYEPHLQHFVSVNEYNVKIVGNGAVIDLQGQQICISYCDKRLDIEDCVIINGNIRFRGDNTDEIDGIPTGSVRYVTFYQPHDYAIRLQGTGSGVLVERNLVVDAVDTGVDFNPYFGASSGLLPTGIGYCFSVQTYDYGFPSAIDNWSFHSKPEVNNELISHFTLLCEYG